MGVISLTVRQIQTMGTDFCELFDARRADSSPFDTLHLLVHVNPIGDGLRFHRSTTSRDKVDATYVCAQVLLRVSWTIKLHATRVVRSIGSTCICHGCQGRGISNRTRHVKGRFTRESRPPLPLSPSPTIARSTIQRTPLG